MNHSPFCRYRRHLLVANAKNQKIGANLDKNFSKKIFTTFATPVTGF